MIPEKILKAEKKTELIIKIEKLLEYWYSNIELAKLLKVHKNTISWLITKKSSYTISLNKIVPVLKIVDVLINKIK